MFCATMTLWNIKIKQSSFSKSHRKSATPLYGKKWHAFNTLLLPEVFCFFLNDTNPIQIFQVQWFAANVLTKASRKLTSSTYAKMHVCSNTLVLLGCVLFPRQGNQSYSFQNKCLYWCSVIQHFSQSWCQLLSSCYCCLWPGFLGHASQD